MTRLDRSILNVCDFCIVAMLVGGFALAVLVSL